jgi:polar amino acid transport system permease protein
MGGWPSFIRDLTEQMPLILAGLVKTLQLAGLISVSGLLLGIVVFYLTLSRSPYIRNAINAYISFFIGMPLITVAFIGFTFNVAAYNAAYLKTAYNGLDKSQLEAASAQGFNPLQIFQFITLPQVIRLSIPALTNQVIANLKDSSVAFLIQYTEFFARVQELAATNFQFFKAYLLAALVYLVLVSVIVLFARAIERRYFIPA